MFAQSIKTNSNSIELKSNIDLAIVEDDIKKPTEHTQDVYNLRIIFP